MESKTYWGLGNKNMGLIRWLSHHSTVNVLMLFVLWYITFCCCIQQGSSMGCIEKERHALVNLKRSLTDPSNRLSSWVGQDCCNWTGIKCDDQTGHVIKLDLRNPIPFNEDRYWQEYDKRARIYDSRVISYRDVFYDSQVDHLYHKSCLVAQEVNISLLDLNHLQHLDLSYNNFSGISIPNFFGSFPELRYLNLSSACFSGVVPQSLGNISTLLSLDLGSEVVLLYPYYRLTVDSLHWVSHLSRLEVLDMSHAHLSAASDSFHAINFLAHLSELYLAKCNLLLHDLSIPFANLTSLHVLDLHDNNFQGPLPTFLENMTALEKLDLESNQFEGEIQIDLSQLCNLKLVDFSSNSLSGEIFKLFRNSSSKCFKEKMLESLDLSLNKLSGNLPNWFSQLKNLAYLDLSTNSFNGSIPPSLAEFTSSVYLDVSKNEFSGTVPEGLGKLSQLEFLGLGSNKLSGHVLDSACRLTNLKKIYLQYNSFIGSFPPSLGRLSSLTVLLVSENQFNGSIPQGLGQLSQLEYLDLSSNQFQGVMSQVHFANLSKLRILDLSSNSLSFKAPPDWVPPFQLQEITLRFCKLGPEFPMWLGTQNKYEILDLSNTGINDSLPKWFFNFSSHLSHALVLNLASNQMRNTVPIVFASGILEEVRLDLSRNNFEGPLPSFTSNVLEKHLSPTLSSEPNSGGIAHYINLDLSSNSFSAGIPHSFCKLKGLENLNLSTNNLFGGIPQCLGDLESVMNLDLSSNNLSGIIPISIGNMTGLSILDLSSNNLSGIIPNSIGSLIYLKWLHLESNKLHGQIPSSLNNLSNLILLDLSENNFSGHIGKWIGESLSTLKYLSLRKNKLHGSIPVELCRMDGLQVVDLSQNNMSGTIPHCLGNFTCMKGTTCDYDWNYERTDEYFDPRSDEITLAVKGKESSYTKILQLVTSFDLSSNELVGEIPEEVTILSTLKFLNFSKNHLEGSIPDKIGNMEMLESLDLSLNQLSGKIPQTMAQLTSLAHLNLSHNKLTGKIPTGPQLQTLDQPSIYMGNPKLCGFPLDNMCPGDKSTLGPTILKDDDENQKDESEMSWFYIGMASGHVTGFFGVCSILFFNKKSRICFLKFLSATHDKLFVIVARF